MRSYGLISEETGYVLRVRESEEAAIREAQRLAAKGGPIVVLGCDRKIQLGGGAASHLDGQFVGRFRAMKRERYGKKVPAGIVCSFH